MQITASFAERSLGSDLQIAWVKIQAKHSMLQISVGDQVKNFSLLNAEILEPLSRFHVVRREVTLGLSYLDALFRK